MPSRHPQRTVDASDLQGRQVEILRVMTMRGEGNLLSAEKVVEIYNEQVGKGVIKAGAIGTREANATLEELVDNGLLRKRGGVLLRNPTYELSDEGGAALRRIEARDRARAPMPTRE